MGNRCREWKYYKILGHGESLCADHPAAPGFESWLRTLLYLSLKLKRPKNQNWTGVGQNFRKNIRTRYWRNVSVLIKGRKLHFSSVWTAYTNKQLQSVFVASQIALFGILCRFRRQNKLFIFFQFGENPAKTFSTFTSGMVLNSVADHFAV